ncbi:MAG TPA: hypothetical protein VE261_01275 [Gaiellaceae bacterium]|nr:hypothetical protein [Gaiellaceae bacterium]
MVAPEVAWYMPGSVHKGDVVECGGSKVKITSLTGSADWAWGGGKPTLTIDARNGAVAIACGTSIPVPQLRENAHYLIGQNGLGRIRGPNTKAAVEKLYGPPRHWSTIGLTATFSNGVLTRAQVNGRRGWVSLTGVAIGDSLAELVWQVPDAKRLDAHHWRIATRLVAVVNSGRYGGVVTGFVVTAR